MVHACPGGEVKLEWTVAPADVSGETAQECAAQLVWDLGRGAVQGWTEKHHGGEPVLVANVTPGSR